MRGCTLNPLWPLVVTLKVNPKGPPTKSNPLILIPKAHPPRSHPKTNTKSIPITPPETPKVILMEPPNV